MSEDDTADDQSGTDATDPDVDERASPPGGRRPSNDELASLLEEFAVRLEAQDVEYKPRAYRRAAENVRSYPGSVAALAEAGQDAVEEIDRVGEAIASKILEYVETGAIERLDELREELPVDLGELTAVQGVGPKTVGTLYAELGIQTLDDLERAAREEQIREVSGFGPKTEENVLENLEFAKQSQDRERLGAARPVADALLERLRGHDAVERAEVAGSIRRWCPTIGDVDVLVAAPPERAEAVVADFLETGEEIESGPSKASVRREGVRVDLRVVEPGQFGSALQYFTGSKEHNVTLRNYALDRGISLNEYGAFDVSGSESDGDGAATTDSGGDGTTTDEADVEPGEAPLTADDPDAERLAGETEASMYGALDLPSIPPELREDRGEIQAAADGELPDLLEHDDVRGDLHVHSQWSDGAESMASMVEGAAAFGHDYVAITDHADGPGTPAGIGLSPEDVLEQVDAVDALRADAPIPVFHGVEANVDVDGDVPFPDDVLAELDFVVASPHSGLSGDATDRLVAAVADPNVDVLGHPSGRLINERSGLTFDAAELGEAAAEHGTALEINSNPARLDLWGEAVQVAIDAGATIAIDTDAHATAEYGHVRYGVHTARRGWAEADDVLNAWDVADVRAFLAD